MQGGAILKFLGIVILMYSIYCFRNFLPIPQTIDSDILGIFLASLVGAAIGGMITYIANIVVLKKNLKIRSTIISKKTIYEPLLVEFRRLKVDIEKRPFISLGKLATLTYSESQFECWGRMKNDGRCHMVPDFINTNISNLEIELEDYASFPSIISEEVGGHFTALLKENGYPFSHRGQNNFFSPEKIINKEKGLFRKVVSDYGISNITENDLTRLNDIFNDYIEQSNYAEVRAQKQISVLATLVNSIDLLDLMIERITHRYERASRI